MFSVVYHDLSMALTVTPYNRHLVPIESTMKFLPILVFAAVLAVSHGRGEFIPAQAGQYRARVIREAHAAGGLGAPVDMFAGQLHQESGWKPAARSGVGALGLAQFMPGSAAWIANLYPADLKPGAPLDPNWAIRALVKYDYWLYGKLPYFQAGDERWGGALASYNAGLGWILKERAKANSPLYFGGANMVCLRNQDACQQTRDYPERIIHMLTPLYLKADWK